MKKLLALALILFSAAAHATTYMPFLSSGAVVPPVGYQTTPTLLGCDITAVSNVNGENGKGQLVSCFVYGAGSATLLGMTSGLKLFICGVEVDNYRALIASKAATYTQVNEVVAQVGALGSPTAGTACDVTMTVNGVSSNTLSSYMTIQPGHQWFVSTAGNDATGVVDDPTHPFRYIQHYSGNSPVAGSLWDTTTTHGDTGLKPGDQEVIRGGAWSDQVGFNAYWMQWHNTTGSIPNGTIGHGFVMFRAYATGGAIEDVHWTGASASNGGMGGPDSADASSGWGGYWTVSDLHLEQVANAQGDGAPINMQYGSTAARMWGNEIGPWPNNGVVVSKAAGITGSGDGMSVQMNYVHDISGLGGGTTCGSNCENHGIYIDEQWNHPTINAEIAYNAIINATAGSCIQFNDASGPGGYFTGANVHHNYIVNCQKMGIRMASDVQTANIYDNIVINPMWSCLNDENIAPSGIAINWVHNTCYETLANDSGSYSNVITPNVDGRTSSNGTINVTHNIVVMSATHATVLAGFVDANGTASHVDENNYWDFKGTVTTYPTDAHKVTADPLFTVTGTNFTLQTGSPAINACTQAEVIAVPTDIYGIARPQTGTGAPSGTKNDIGATQGIGT